MSGSPSTAALSLGLGAIVCLFAYLAGADLLRAGAIGAAACVVAAIACRITDG